ncbi:MAG: hypothetical protein ACRYF0_03960 [Janthinobacterium lividum]
MTSWSSNDATISEDEVSYCCYRVGGVSIVITSYTHVTPSGQGFTA